MYVHDSAHAQDWRNVEVTTYAMRVEDTNVPWGGIMAYARTNHGTIGNEDESVCDDRGYGGMLAYTGNVKFEKEVNHRADERGGHGYAQPPSKTRYIGGLPKNRWIGYKFVVRDMAAGTKVKLELWLDETDGERGGALGEGCRVRRRRYELGQKRLRPAPVRSLCTGDRHPAASHGVRCASWLRDASAQRYRLFPQRWRRPARASL